MSAPIDLAQRIGGKRFALALLVLATAIAGRALNWIDGAQLVTLARDVLWIYGAANVGGRGLDAVTAAIAARKASSAEAAP